MVFGVKMKCKQCDFPLSIYNVDDNFWFEDKQTFVFVCPVCSSKSELISSIFEHKHITKPYLEMLIVDSENKEKQLDYMPQYQKDLILTHLCSCTHCSSVLESMRLIKISNEIEFNRNIYNFFIMQAIDVSRKLSNEEVKINGVGIKSFKFHNQEFYISKKHLFYECKKDNAKLLCYVIEHDCTNIGMVSFIKHSDFIVLDKIWLKSEERLEKEKRFLNNIKTGNMKVLIDLVTKECNFL